VSEPVEKADVRIKGVKIDARDLVSVVRDAEPGRTAMAIVTLRSTSADERRRAQQIKLGDAVEIRGSQSAFQGKVVGIEPRFLPGDRSELMIRAFHRDPPGAVGPGARVTALGLVAFLEAGTAQQYRAGLALLLRYPPPPEQVQKRVEQLLAPLRKVLAALPGGSKTAFHALEEEIAGMLQLGDVERMGIAHELTMTSLKPGRP
jgi:hypothetical protein